MISLKHIRILIVVLMLPVAMLAQAPTMTFDGNSLRVTVPTGYLELQKADIQNEALCECIDWGGRESCIFMSSPDPYVLHPVGLSTTAPLSIKGTFEDEPIEIQVEMKEPTEGTSTEGPSKEGLGANLPYILGAVGLLLLLAIFFILIKRKKGRRPVEKKVNDGPTVLNMINDESIVYEKGLEHVKSHLGEYLSFDMDRVFTDTAINKVYLSTALVKKLYDFFNSSIEDGGRTNETGCFILGCWDQEPGNKNRYDISLEYMVEPGDDADFGEYSLNFGKKIGINTASILDTLATKSKRDYVLTCWMHSHPGLGLFLSNQDLIVQQQLAYSDARNRLLAIVIDTNSPEFKTGFFSPKADGKMNNQEDVKCWFSFEEIYRQSRELSRNGNSAKDLLTDFKANPDYFNMDLNDEQLSHLGFAGHAINQIDNALFSNLKGVIGFLYGDEEQGYLQVGCCLPYENEEKKGCLINDAALTEDALASYSAELNGCQLFVQCISDDQLQIWTRNAAGGFTKTGATTMSQMKEWNRRKRI